MGHIITIKQELKTTGYASYTVKMTVDEGDNIETIEFNYADSNAIFPLYNSLINTIRDYEDVTIKLETCDPRFAREVKGIPNKNARMLSILTDLRTRNRITFDIIENE